MLQIQAHDAILRRHGEGFETSPAPNRNGSYEDHVMAKKPLPSPEVLRQLLRYEPETGKLFWLQRGPQWFTRDGCAPEAVAAQWNARYAGQEAFTASLSSGYRTGSIFDCMYRAHRVIWAMTSGKWPLHMIDHINGDRSDNRLTNLREATNAENMQNRGPTRKNATGFKGVIRRGRKFSARIKVDGRTTYLGFHDTAEQAASAYARASADLHSEFGRLK